MNFPDAFREKMMQLLGAEFTAFEASYDRPRKRGLRVNVSKITPEEFERNAPFPVERIPWLENGFFYPEEIRPAQHPFYAAGLYYLQEPSAMTPASRLPLEAGDSDLDLCAAPGGKATELAARLAVLDRKKTETEAAASGEASAEAGSHKERGILAANDISQPRAKALLHNLEMTGTANYVVLNETPERLTKPFIGYFDKILVDAPCSGEGMFRKEEEALRLWSPERVADFARQQKTILDAAYTMLRPCGMLLYSTCTFSPEENEQQIAAFLKRYPDMELQEITPYEGFAPGRADWTGSGQTDPLHLDRCVRIWPHKMDGEGHFLALMKKKEAGQNTEEDPVGSKSRTKAAGKKQRTDKRKVKERLSPDREKMQLLRSFLCGITGDAARAEEICRAVEMRQEKAYIPVLSGEKLAGLHVMRGGIYLGEWKKNRFEPSQAWAMTFAERPAPGEIRTWLPQDHTLTLSLEDPRLKKYLAGESVPSEACEEGWILILAEQYPVAWGKVVHGLVKNHYPVSWRIQERT